MQSLEEGSLSGQWVQCCTRNGLYEFLNIFSFTELTCQIANWLGELTATESKECVPRWLMLACKLSGKRTQNTNIRRKLGHYDTALVIRSRLGNVPLYFEDCSLACMREGGNTVGLYNKLWWHCVCVHMFLTGQLSCFDIHVTLRRNLKVWILICNYVANVWKGCMHRSLLEAISCL